MRVCNVKPSLCCGGFTLACNRAAGSGSVGSLPSWTVLVVVMDLSKLWSPNKSQPDGGTPPAVDPPLEPVTQAQPRMAAGMARSPPAGTSTHPAGLAAGATPTHLAGPPASHTTQVGSDALFAAAADSEQMTTAGMQAGQPSSGNLQVSFADLLVDADPNDYDHNADPFESAPDSNDPTTTHFALFLQKLSQKH